MASNQFTNFTFNQNGVIIPDTNDLKTTVQDEFKSAFGSDLSLEDSTPQGRLIDIETNARQDVINFTATVANSICNAQKSGGSILDNWLSNFNLQRGTAQASVVNVVVTGLPNTIIPIGAQAQDVNGNIWLNESEIIIGNNGTATGVFYSQEQGAITLEANQLNKIISGQALGVTGWQSINNPSSAIEGTTVMNDYGAQQLLTNCLFRGSALFGNYKSAVIKNVNGVIDCFTLENPYNEILPVDNIELAQHSVYVAVLGGEAQEIGQQLFYIKSAGCAWNGNTTVIAKDLVFNTSSPVTFEIPEPLPIGVELSITNLNNTSDNLIDDIKNVLINYSNNLYAENNLPAPYIRGTVNTYTLTRALMSNIEGITVNSLKIAPYIAPTNINITITQGAGLSNPSVVLDTFIGQISETGIYNFIYGINFNTSTASVSQTEGSGLSQLEINKNQFFQLFNTSETYTFKIQTTTEGLWECEQNGNFYTLAQLGISYEGEADTESVVQVEATVNNSWLYNNESITLGTYGITISGSPALNDVLTVNLYVAKNIIHATSRIVKASVVSGIYWAHVDAETFNSQIKASGVYAFVYNTLNQWTLDYAPVDISQYGLTVFGQPIVNDQIIVQFNDGDYTTQPLQVYCTEYPSFSTENIYVTITNTTQIYN